MRYAMKCRFLGVLAFLVCASALARVALAQAPQPPGKGILLLKGTEFSTCEPGAEKQTGILLLKGSGRGNYPLAPPAGGPAEQRKAGFPTAPWEPAPCATRQDENVRRLGAKGEIPEPVRSAPAVIQVLGPPIKE